MSNKRFLVSDENDNLCHDLTKPLLRFVLRFRVQPETGFNYEYLTFIFIFGSISNSFIFK